MRADRVERRRREKICDRCGFPFVEGYTWPSLGIPVMLCRDCTQDIDESVQSYGEDRPASRDRFLARLRQIGT